MPYEPSALAVTEPATITSEDNASMPENSETIQPDYSHYKRHHHPHPTSSPDAPTPIPVPTSIPSPTPTPRPVANPAPIAGAESIGSNQGIMWGVNSHPMEGAPSPNTTIPFNQQMATIAAIGLKNFRMDLYDTHANLTSVLTSVIAAGKAHGIQILPVLIPNFLSYANETDAYNAGYAMGNAYAAQFKNDVHVWELGNEWDDAVGFANPSSNPDGSIISQYNQAHYVLARGALRGLLDGIHAADSTSKGIVDTQGTCHYGFTDGLWHDGVQWDITGEHWYSQPGNITNMTGFCKAGALNKAALLHAHYGRPIWITEFNSSDNPADKATMATWLITNMLQWNSIAQTYDIESALIYEHYDDPDADSGNAADMQNHFGIADQNGNLNEAGTAVQNFLIQRPSVIYGR